MLELGCINSCEVGLDTQLSVPFLLRTYNDTYNALIANGQNWPVKKPLIK